MLNLKSFPIFNTLPNREVEVLKKAARFQKFSSGTTFVKEGETLDEFFLVVEGQVSVLKSHGSRKKTLFSLDPGDTYGEVEILNGTPSCATLVGYQDFQIMFIPKDSFLRLIGLYPGFAREARQIYARRATTLLEKGLSKSMFGQVLTFFNVKGGAGKSVISANVGVMLAKLWRKKVVVVDLNLPFGDQAILLSLPTEKNIHVLSESRPPLTLASIEEQLTEHGPSGLKVLLPPPLPEMAEKIRPDFVEEILEVLRANYDFVILDTQNQLSDMELMALEFCDMIFLVMTMELTFIKNTKVLLDLFRRMKIPREKVKVILNRAFKTLGLEPTRVEKSLRYAISHFIPSEGDIVIPSVNRGTPFVLDEREGSPLYLSIQKLCQRLVGEEPEKGTWNMFSLIREVFGLGS
jgi:pilus assembly protein CpaE